MKVTYKEKGEYSGPNMTIGKTYVVIGIEADLYRIVNDSNDPCLYQPIQFAVEDSVEPTFWVTEYGKDGERYSYPPSWNAVGFFENYHNKVESVRKQFWNEYRELYETNSV